jgi:aryl-alcohol dehydrogenase-like predicted oxidoreductase
MNSAVRRLALGTVQLGLDYGATNRHGMPSAAEAAAIVEMALAVGIDTIDTAAAYGHAERLLGEILPPDSSVRIVTKIACSSEDEPERLRGAVMRSLERLRRSSVDAVLLHDASLLAGAVARRIADEIRALRDEGLAQRIGVSVDSLDQLQCAAQLLDLNLVQLPLSVLDQRFHTSGWLERLSQRGVEIHARSIFLQGILITPVDALPPYFLPIAQKLRDFECDMRKLGCDRMVGCLSFALQQALVQRIVIGVNSRAELAQVLSAAERGGQLVADFSGYATEDESMLAPWCWPPREALIAHRETTLQ